MSYVILDLEWNGAYSKALHRFVNEIIEFGAVKTDDEFNIIDTYSVLVAPKIGRKLCPKVKQLTKISFDELKSCGIKAQIFGGVMGPCMNLISNLGFILIAAFGGWFAIKGIITVGTIQAFILYSKQFSRPINEIANQYANIQTAIAGAERIFEVSCFKAYCI